MHPPEVPGARPDPRRCRSHQPGAARLPRPVRRQTCTERHRRMRPVILGRSKRANVWTARTCRRGRTSSMDVKPLAGQAALITGGGGGIGQASAAWLARDGAAVVIMGRTEATLLDARRAIHSFAGNDAVVEVVVGDALDENQVRQAFQRAAGLADRL